MGVVDERSRVPALGEDALAELRGALDLPEVDAAFLIGSRARGTANQLSDIDVAVLHAPGLDAEARLDLRLRLTADAGAALDTTEVDVVMLNGAPPLLRHRALREGILLLDRNPSARIDFYVRTLTDYVDTQPPRAPASQQLRAQSGRTSVVDRPKVESRLERLERLLTELEDIRRAGRETYDREFRQRLATQRALQLAIQVCIDIAGYLLAEDPEPMPANYRGVFAVLSAQGLDPALAERLGAAAGLRNILVHDYLDIDEDVVWGSLGHLDDLREFAAFATTRLD